MLSRAAVCFQINEPWKVVDVDIEEPRSREVQVRMAYAGLCHSDEHHRLNGAGRGLPMPMVGGHEGSGVVEAVGSDVTSLRVGDHVTATFVPSCGSCRWCTAGRSFLCVAGFAMPSGAMLSDGTFRYHHDGEPIGRIGQLGTFAERMVCLEASLVKVDAEVPLDIAAISSCAVATGYGSVVHRGRADPGDVVVVVGAGGVGTAAILGAGAVGAGSIVVVDPVPYKREQAQRLGATHTASSIEEAADVVADASGKAMADVVVLTVPTLDGSMLPAAMALAARDGRVVCTAVARRGLSDLQLDLNDLMMGNKAILGCLYGSRNPVDNITEILQLYKDGRLELDRIISQRYPLADVQRGFDELHAGTTLRGVIDMGLAALG